MPNYLNIGDVIFARETIQNDGGVPEQPEDAVFARPGSRGVVVQIGAAAADMRQEIILARFEGTDGVLGPPVGCLLEELTQDEAEAAALA